MRSRALLVGLLLSGCVATPPKLSGPYVAGILPSDIQEIQTVVSARPDLQHHIRTLEAHRPEKVYVRTAHATDGPDYWSGDAFYVIKRSGRWYIDESSIAAFARIKPTS
jgi:hypothetical protein